MLAAEYKFEIKRLEAELKVMSAYADKLADGLPEGMLPKDIEIMRAENVNLMQFYESVRTGTRDMYHTADEKLIDVIEEAITEYEK